MKKHFNVYYLGFVALGFLAVAFFFQLIIPNEPIRNVFGTIGGGMIVAIVLYVIVWKMILNK